MWYTARYTCVSNQLEASYCKLHVSKSGPRNYIGTVQNKHDYKRHPLELFKRIKKKQVSPSLGMIEPTACGLGWKTSCLRINKSTRRTIVSKSIVGSWNFAG